MGVDFGEISIHLIVQRVNRLLAEVSTPNAGLIGDDEDEIPLIIGQLDRLSGTRNPHEIGPVVDIATINIERAIPIKIYRLFQSRLLIHHLFLEQPYRRFILHDILYHSRGDREGKALLCSNR